MNPSGFAVLLLVGTVLFVVGWAGNLALGVMAVGGFGLVVSAFASKR